MTTSAYSGGGGESGVGEEIRFPVTEDGADPDFSPFESLIVCDLVNHRLYMNALLAHREGQRLPFEHIDIEELERLEKSGALKDLGYGASNAPSRTRIPPSAADPTKPARIVEYRPRVQDIVDWHLARPWLDEKKKEDEEFTDYVKRLKIVYPDEPEEAFEVFTATPEAFPDERESLDKVDPTPGQMAQFLENMAGDSPEQTVQREMLALLGERFGGVLQVGTGRRIVQSLLMFVDFTIRKDGEKNRLMW